MYRISLGTKFQFKQKTFMFWTKFTQKGYINLPWLMFTGFSRNAKQKESAHFKVCLCKRRMDNYIVRYLQKQPPRGVLKGTLMQI